MIPLLISTARTGSSIISNLMYQLGKEQIGYKNYLNEFFTVTELYKPLYQVIDNVITQIECHRINSVWYTSAREERLKRLDLIQYDPYYALKIFPEDLEPEILDFIKRNYKIIGLERKDKEDQFISFSHMLTTNVAAFSKDDTTIINSIKVNRNHLGPFIAHIKNFKRLQNILQFPIMYYEDYYNAINKQEFLCSNLGIAVKPIELIVESKETPYLLNKEDIIENKKEWAEMKIILKKLL